MVTEMEYYKSLAEQYDECKGEECVDMCEMESWGKDEWSFDKYDLFDIVEPAFCELWMLTGCFDNEPTVMSDGDLMDEFVRAWKLVNELIGGVRRGDKMWWYMVTRDLQDCGSFINKVVGDEWLTDEFRKAYEEVCAYEL